MIKSNKTNISFPSFIRLNINSINLTENQKQSAMTINKQVSSQHTLVTSNLTCNTGALSCNKDLFIKGKIKVNVQDNNKIQFNGRVNLTNHTVSYNGAQNFENINEKKPQQYLPFGLFKTIQCNSCMRTSKSGGHVGSGDIGRLTKLGWDSYSEQYRETNNSVVSINTSDKTQLLFTASPNQPKLLRISLYFMKRGDWLDNGRGGVFILGVNVNGQDKTLSSTSSVGSTYYRLKTMQCIACTYYATSNGYFFAQNQGEWFRADVFSWNVVELPFFYNQTP